MTLQEFQKTLKKKNLFDKYWYSGLCIVTIALSLVLLFLVFTEPEKKENHPFYYFGFLFLFSFGTYGFYKLPNRFKIVSIQNTKSLNCKKIALIKVVELFGSIPKDITENYISFRYQKSFWRSSFNVHLFFDEKQVCFSVKGNEGGFIDFGETERLREKIRNQIEITLMQEETFTVKE